MWCHYLRRSSSTVGPERIVGPSSLRLRGGLRLRTRRGGLRDRLLLSSRLGRRWGGEGEAEREYDRERDELLSLLPLSLLLDRLSLSLSYRRRLPPRDARSRLRERLLLSRSLLLLLVRAVLSLDGTRDELVMAAAAGATSAATDRALSATAASATCCFFSSSPVFSCSRACSFLSASFSRILLCCSGLMDLDGAADRANSAARRAGLILVLRLISSTSSGCFESAVSVG